MREYTGDFDQYYADPLQCDEPSREQHERDVKELEGMFLALRTKSLLGSRERWLGVIRFILHPASRVKLARAVRYVFRNRYPDRPHHFRVETAQRALDYLLIYFYEIEKCNYRDEGRFDHWLFAVWRRSALRAYDDLVRPDRVIREDLLGTLRQLHQERRIRKKINEDRLQLFYYLVSRLPDNLQQVREVMFLSMSGASREEIAYALGVTSNRVSQLVSRGIRLLKAQAERLLANGETT